MARVSTLNSYTTWCMHRRMKFCDGWWRVSADLRGDVIPFTQCMERESAEACGVNYFDAFDVCIIELMGEPMFSWVLLLLCMMMSKMRHSSHAYTA